MTAAIFYHPEAYTTAGPTLMGRHAAGESFLRGFLGHSSARAFWVQVQQLAHAQYFAKTVSTIGRSEPIRVVDKNTLAILGEAGVVYYPGPGIGEHAFQRAAYGHGAGRLCGITHTTSSAGAMDALAGLLTAPVQPWDAVICTSVAVKNNVTRLLQAQALYLKERLGATRLVLPLLPVIPLGIHTQDFAFTEEQRVAARVRLGVDVDTLVVLFMGRLSFHAKAHPLAMYQALEAAAKQTGKSVVLVECGWHANKFIEEAYEEAARLACPSVQLVGLDGRKAEDRQTAWAGADVFCSLSDNIQETFGLVPLEAMAAGLPVLVSDWDGYRDTVRDGIDGFRIPTLMPGAGLGRDLAERHALEIDTYDMYCGHTCSLVAVDVAATTQAFVRLFESPERRRLMGEAGRAHVRAKFDWATIIPSYESLWAQQTEIRKQQTASLRPITQLWPARMDPFHAFASYPTRLLTPQTLLGLVDVDIDMALQRTLAYRRIAMFNFAEFVLPTDHEIRTVLTAADSGPRPAEELIAGIHPERQPHVFRALVWLVKLGTLTVG